MLGNRALLETYLCKKLFHDRCTMCVQAHGCRTSSNYCTVLRTLINHALHSFRHQFPPTPSRGNEPGSGIPLWQRATPTKSNGAVSGDSSSHSSSPEAPDKGALTNGAEPHSEPTDERQGKEEETNWKETLHNSIIGTLGDELINFSLNVFFVLCVFVCALYKQKKCNNNSFKLLSVIFCLFYLLL